jgi:GTP1/Obg family GTP-binding protein
MLIFTQILKHFINLNCIEDFYHDLLDFKDDIIHFEDLLCVIDANGVDLTDNQVGYLKAYLDKKTFNVPFIMETFLRVDPNYYGIY